MDLGFDRTKLEQWRAVLLRHLSHPLKLRLAVVAGVLLLALLAAYLPLEDRIRQASAQVTNERTRLDSITEVETLIRQVNAYRPRINSHSDTNEWVQYLLSGMRATQVKLHDMESREPRRVGPYDAVAFSVEVEGNYDRLKQFVEWLEQSDRLLRVDSVRFERRPNSLMVRVMLLGLVTRRGQQTGEGPQVIPPAAAQPDAPASAPARKNTDFTD